MVYPRRSTPLYPRIVLRFQPLRRESLRLDYRRIYGQHRRRSLPGSPQRIFHSLPPPEQPSPPPPPSPPQTPFSETPRLLTSPYLLFLRDNVCRQGQAD